MFRFLRAIVEFIAAFFGVMLVLGLFLIWRLNSGPITSSFLTPYIEAGVDSIIPDTRTSIAHTLLTWSSAEHSVQLHADGILIKDRDDIVIAEVPSIDVEVSAIGAVFGQFIPKELQVDHPQIRLQRAPDGEFYFGNRTQDADAPADGKKALARLAHNLAHAYITHALEIRRAVFNVHDEVTNSDWAVSIPGITLERVAGQLAGQATVEVTQQNEVSTIDVHYNYDHAKASHVLQTRFDDITPSFFAGGHPATLGLAQAAIFDLPLSGSVTLAFDNDLNIEAAALDLQGGEGNLVYPDYWDAPRKIKSVDVKGDYDHAQGNLNAAVAVDLGGPKLNVAITGTKPSLPLHDLDFEVNEKLDNYPMDQFDRIWPKPALPNVRGWMIANMSKGKFDHGEAVFKGALSWNDLAKTIVTDGKGRVQASGARVNYMAGMPAIDNVSADMSFDLAQVNIQVLGGSIGNLKAKPFTIKMSDLQDKVQKIDIPIAMTGPVSDALRLIDSPPLGYARAIGLSPDDIGGSIDGVFDLSFPLLENLLMKDIELKANAALTNVASSNLVKGFDVTQGNLALTLDTAGFTVKGPAQVNKVPLQIAWQQKFNQAKGEPIMQASVTGNVTGDQWKALGLDAMDGTKGPVAIAIQLSESEKGKKRMTGSADMLNAEMQIDQINWKKPAGTAAILKFDAEMEDDKNIIVKTVDLSGAQLKGKGAAVLSPDGRNILALNMNGLVVGRTNADVRFTQTLGDAGALRFDANGESLDVSGFQGGREPGHTDPRTKEFHIKVGKLWTGDTGLIAEADGYAIRNGRNWQEISLHGLADGDQPLDIGLQPRDGGRVFSVACGDFGKALKGFGFTDAVSGGKLDVHGFSPADNPDRIEGKARIGRFTASNLPVLAVLLNATSPFGIGNLLTGTVDFDRLDGKFRWQGDDVELIEVRAAGSAVGMNAEGKVNLENGSADLRGTIVPFSMVNRMLNWIPVLGSVLTGGEGGGVLAVAYTMTGTLSTPKVSVNPVSLLTPGFLRNLFFSSGDDGADDEAAEPLVVPAPVGVVAPSNINQKK